MSTSHSIASPPQKIANMLGAGALSHAYIQYPPFRCNIPGSIGMMYDDANRLLLVPSPGKVFSWGVSRNPNSDSWTSITSVDDGPVLAARFSLDGKILAIQRSENEIAFFNRENGLKFRQLCRSQTETILGFFWTDCPICDIVYVTSSGLELYSLLPASDGLKLVDVKASSVNWYLYTHESRMVLLASGVQCKTFLGYQFSAGGIIKLPKFDAIMKKTEANQKPVLGPEDVHIATMYGRLYCLQVDRIAMEINIYRFYRDAVVPQGVLPIYSENVAFSVVDNVLLVHQISSKVALLYDIFSDMKSPISAPLPLLLRGPKDDPSLSSKAEIDNDGFNSLSASECNIYGEGWVFANPDIILDHAHGILWRIHLDLEAISASSSDVVTLLAFLQRRKLGASKAKELSIAVVRSIIVEKRPLSIISEAMDVINVAFSQFEKTRSHKPKVLKPVTTNPPEKAPSVENQPAVCVAPSGDDTSSTETGLAATDKASQKSQGDDSIVEEKGEPSTTSETKSSDVIVSTTNNSLVNVSAISPDEMHQHIFAVIDNLVEVDPFFLAATVVQYMRSATTEKLKVPSKLQVLLVQLLARDERYTDVMHFIHTKILEPSKEVAMELLESGKLYRPIYVQGLNMLKQLSQHADYLPILLKEGRLTEALRYARQNRVDAVSPSTFLEYAAATKDSQKLACVLRFCLDFVPKFDKTAEYDKYMSLLKSSTYMCMAG